MRTLQEKYNAILEGNFSKEQFRRDAVMQLPNVVSKFNSFEDMTTILKNRGMIAEVKKDIHTSEYAKTDAKPEDHISLDLIDAGIKCELDEKFGRLDVSEEDYEKAKATAIKNLSKNPLYYIEKDSDQMPEPGEKMEKATLKEGREQLLEMLASIIDQAKKYAKDKYPHLTDKDVDDFVRMHGKDLMNGADLETEFDNYYQGNFDMDEEVSNDYSPLAYAQRVAAGRMNIEDAMKETGFPYTTLMAMVKKIKNLAQDTLKEDEDGLEEATLELSAKDMEKLHKNGKIKLPDGSVLHYTGKVTEEDEEKAYKDGVTQSSIDTAMQQAGMKESQLKEAVKALIKKTLES